MWLAEDDEEHSKHFVLSFVMHLLRLFSNSKPRITPKQAQMYS
jgi:hypothetical protein